MSKDREYWNHAFHEFEYYDGPEYELERRKVSAAVGDIQTLLELAEVSSREVEDIQGAITKSRSRTLYFATAFYMLVLLSMYFILAAMKSGYFTGVVERAGVLVVFLTVISFVLGAAVESMRERRRLLRELDIELSASGQLISAVDEQIQRVRSSPAVTPLSMFALEVRVRRMERKLVR